MNDSTSPPIKRRMSPADRRDSLITAASRLFAGGTYASTTTAAIAAETGVTEPVLYRHFRSKSDLYAACIERAWNDVRTLLDEVLAQEPDASRWMLVLADRGLGSLGSRSGRGRLWVQAMTDASEDPAVRPLVIEHVRSVHAYVASVARRAQEAGGICADRDADAEAWIFISIGIMYVISGRLDDVAHGSFPAILDARQRWLRG